MKRQSTHASVAVAGTIAILLLGWQRSPVAKRPRPRCKSAYRGLPGCPGTSQATRLTSRLNSSR